MSRKTKYILIAIAYLLFPFDLIPDFIRPLGIIDDVIVAFLLYRHYSKNHGSGKKDSATVDGPRAEEQAPPAPPSSDDPYQVLGIDRDATEVEIQKRYRELIKQYHPDKVAHLGAEFQQIAHQKTVEIQSAYEKICSL